MPSYSESAAHRCTAACRWLFALSAEEIAELQNLLVPHCPAQAEGVEVSLQLNDSPFQGDGYGLRPVSGS